MPVADQDAGVAGQDAAGVDRSGGPVPGVHQRQVPGTGHVQVPQAPGGAGRGLVRVQCRRGPQQVPHMVREPAGPDQCGGLAADRGHPPGGHRQAGQLGQQLRGPRDRDVMPADQIRGLRVHLGAVAGAGPHVRRQHRLADDPAARAGPGLRHVLGHLRRWRGRDVGDLVAALCQHWHAGQVRAAAPAGQRGQLDPLIGVIGQAHRGTRVAGLLTRPPLPPLPQRTVSRLLPVRAVRRRRPRRRRGILPDLPLQLLHPRLQPADQLVRLRQLQRQLSMRQCGQLLRREHTGHSTQTCPAAGPQSTTRHGVSHHQLTTPRPLGGTLRPLLNSYVSRF